MSMVDWLKGIFPPVVTPFREDESTDIEAFRNELRYLIKVGVNGVALTGTTAEGSSLSESEHQQLFEVAKQECSGKIPFLAGIIADSTREAVRLAKVANAAGADGLMITPVHYLVPTEAGIFDYYRRIAEAADLPVVIYNVVEKVDLSPELIARLAEIPNIAGVKQSAGDIHKLVEIVRLTKDTDFTVMSGVDDLQMSCLQLGAKGTICAVNSVVPELCIELYQAVQRGDTAKAIELHYKILPIVRTVIMVKNNFPATVKAAINLRGRSAGYPRSPLTPPDDSQIREIRRVLTEAGMI